MQSSAYCSHAAALLLRFETAVASLDTCDLQHSRAFPDVGQGPQHSLFAIMGVINGHQDVGGLGRAMCVDRNTVDGAATHVVLLAVAVVGVGVGIFQVCLPPRFANCETFTKTTNHRHGRLLNNILYSLRFSGMPAHSHAASPTNGTKR